MVPLQKKTSSLHELLYYDIATMRNGDLRKGLIEYKTLLTALHSAMHSLEEKDLEKFDALVGENACQIRAIKIAIISSQNQIPFKKLKKQIKHAEAKITALLLHKKINALMLSGASLKEVIEKEELNIALTADEMFVLQSFLLSLMKESEIDLQPPFCMRDKSAPKKLKSLDPDISSQFSKNIASKTRRLLAEASVQFIREMAWDLKDPHLARMTSKEFSKEHNAWPCLPMFWTYKTLLKVAKKELIPLIIHVKFMGQSNNEHKITDEETLFFKPTTNSNNYMSSKPDEADLTKPACIIQGVVRLSPHTSFSKNKWKNDLLKHSIYDIILAGAADHKQYPNENISLSINDPEFENYKFLAKSKGFSIDNQTTFFINHVYPSQVDKFFPYIEHNLNVSVNS